MNECHEHSVAVNSRALRVSDYRQASACAMSRQQMVNVADGLILAIARSRNCCNVLLKSQVPI